MIAPSSLFPNSNFIPPEPRDPVVSAPSNPVPGAPLAGTPWLEELYRTTAPSGTAGQRAMDEALAPVPASQETAATPVPFNDPALQTAFPAGPHSLPSTYRLGREGDALETSAVQYALGRLGFYEALVDGNFGPLTEERVADFQASRFGRRYGLAVTGEVDVAMLRVLDQELARLPTETPAAASGDVWAYLSDFDARGLTTISSNAPRSSLSWSHPDIQEAYGRFVGEYWNVLKDNRVEVDCKALALLFMDQFRNKVRQDLGVRLPLPRNGHYGIPEPSWTVATPEQPLGWFTRTDELETVREGYEAIKLVESLDPNFSMVRGPNLRYGNVSAPQTARAATPVPQTPPVDNGGDESVAEIDVNALRPGDIIFIDHSDSGASYDHTVNVIDVERFSSGQVSRLVLALGSFDDVRDKLSSTPATSLSQVNNYAEEVLVFFNEDGTIRSSGTTYTTEPTYLVEPRYSHQKTLMELREGGTLFVARWGHSTTVTEPPELQAYEESEPTGLGDEPPAEEPDSPGSPDPFLDGEGFGDVSSRFSGLY